MRVRHAGRARGARAAGAPTRSRCTGRPRARGRRDLAGPGEWHPGRGRSARSPSRARRDAIRATRSGRRSAATVRPAAPTRQAMKAVFPPGAAHDVEDPVTGLRAQRVHDERRRLVLDGEPPLVPSRERGGVAAVHEDAPRVDRADPPVDAGGGQGREGLLHGRTAVVHPEAEGARTLNPAAAGSTSSRGRSVRSSAIAQDVIPVLRLIARSSRPAGGTGGPVASRRRIAFTNPRSRGTTSPHGLPHRRVRGDARVQDLVRAEAERGARARRHPRDRSGGARADRVVQPGGVTDRPVRQLGGERPVPLVEAASVRAPPGALGSNTRPRR